MDLYFSALVKRLSEILMCVVGGELTFDVTALLVESTSRLTTLAKRTFDLTSLKAHTYDCEARWQGVCCWSSFVHNVI